MPRVKPNKIAKSAKSVLNKLAANGVQAPSPVPAWQPHLSHYPDQRLLTFKSPKELDAAIDLLWTADLRNLPHDTPDGKSLVVPAEAVGYFARAGLRFTENTVLSISDLSEAEIRRLRG
jgi:hypothetical protein